MTVASLAVTLRPERFSSGIVLVFFSITVRQYNLDHNDFSYLTLNKYTLSNRFV